jgi:hypothetical protein
MRLQAMDRLHSTCTDSPTLSTVDFPSTEGAHRRMVRSLEPDAMQSPLGEYATVYTAACDACWGKGRRGRLVGNVNRKMP